MSVISFNTVSLRKLIFYHLLIERNPSWQFMIP
nr:MAG TPA: hypothetical protein [Caudoviricetes sp.]